MESLHERRARKQAQFGRYMRGIICNDYKSIADGLPTPDADDPDWKASPEEFTLHEIEHGNVVETKYAAKWEPVKQQYVCVPVHIRTYEPAQRHGSRSRSRSPARRQPRDQQQRRSRSRSRSPSSPEHRRRRDGPLTDDDHQEFMKTQSKCESRCYEHGYVIIPMTRENEAPYAFIVPRSFVTLHDTAMLDRCKHKVDPAHDESMQTWIKDVARRWSRWRQPLDHRMEFPNGCTLYSLNIPRIGHPLDYPLHTVDPAAAAAAAAAAY